MSLQHIDLPEGDTLIVRAVPRKAVPQPEPERDLDILLTIPPVTIYARPDGTYVHFLSDLDICNDGSGPSHGDEYHQAQTAYYSGGIDGGKYLNADKDKYLVIPPQVRAMVAPVVMGCQGRVTNMQTGAVSDAVTGDIGPEDKTGECAYCLAKELNPSVTYNSGDTNRIYLYEMWPGKPAVVDGHVYHLQPG